MDFDIWTIIRVAIVVALIRIQISDTRVLYLVILCVKIFLYTRVIHDILCNFEETPQQSAYLNGAKFVHDHKFVTVSQNKTVRLWDYRMLDSLEKPLHHDSVPHVPSAFCMSENNISFAFPETNGISMYHNIYKSQRFLWKWDMIYVILLIVFPLKTALISSSKTWLTAE